MVKNLLHYQFRTWSIALTQSISAFWRCWQPVRNTCECHNSYPASFLILYSKHSKLHTSWWQSRNSCDVETLYTSAAAFDEDLCDATLLYLKTSRYVVPYSVLSACIKVPPVVVTNVLCIGLKQPSYNIVNAPYVMVGTSRVLSSSNVPVCRHEIEWRGWRQRAHYNCAVIANYSDTVINR